MKKLFLTLCCFFSITAHAQVLSLDRMMEMAFSKAGEHLAKMDLPTGQGSASTQPALSTQEVEIAFSPNQGGEALVLKSIRSAKKSIRLAAYSFTSKTVVEALIAAKKRGVDVKLIVDYKNNYAECEKNSKRCSGSHAVAALVNAGVDARVVSKYAIFHHKFIVIDDMHLQTGSYNYSAAAHKSNAENVLVLWNNPAVAKTFTEQWNKHWAEGEKAPMAY